MVQTNYINTTDDLEICFKECKVPIVKKLSNGVDFEFDDDYNLSKVVLPNFCKMIHTQYPSNTIFEYYHTIFDKKKATIIVKVNNRPIKINIDLNELEE